MSTDQIWKNSEDRKIKKALRRARRRDPDPYSQVTLRVWSTGELQRFQSRKENWTVIANLSQGRGAGFQSYLIGCPLWQLTNDIPARMPSDPADQAIWQRMINETYERANKDWL